MRSYNMWHPTIVLLLVIPVAAHGQQVSTVGKKGDRHLITRPRPPFLRCEGSLESRFEI